MLPSLKRRSSAFSPQNFWNLAAFFLSSAAGPWSTRRPMFAGSNRTATCKLWLSLVDGPEFLVDQGFDGTLLISRDLILSDNPSLSTANTRLAKLVVCKLWSQLDTISFR